METLTILFSVFDMFFVYFFVIFLNEKMQCFVVII